MVCATNVVCPWRSAATSAAVVVPDIATCTSIVHVVDGLLLPGNVSSSQSAALGASSPVADVLRAFEPGAASEPLPGGALDNCPECRVVVACCIHGTPPDWQSVCMTSYVCGALLVRITRRWLLADYMNTCVLPKRGMRATLVQICSHLLGKQATVHPYLQD